MKRKKTSLLSIGVVLSAAAFLGCGGSDSSKANLNPPTPKDEPHSPDELHSPVIPIYRIGKPSTIFQSLLDPLVSIQANYAAYAQLEEQIKQNKAVDLILEYKNINHSFYHIILKSNNRPVGENFIFVDIDKIEILTQLISQIHTPSKHQIIDYKEYFFTDQYWKQNADQTIIDNSLKNNAFNASQNMQYTVNLRIQKTSAGDYNLSNINISGLNLVKNDFVLKKDQVDSSESFLALQPVLSTLFANFEESKNILN